jgi:AcrR family transcriptional regulator
LPTSTSARRDVRWTGLRPEERVAARRRLLVDVAFDLLGTEGWNRTSVRAVCARAELNARYFYESFEDLDALVVAVYDRVVEELAADVLAAQGAAAPDARAQARAGIEAIVRFVDEDRRRARILYVEALGNEALNRRRVETAQALVGVVARRAVEGRRTSKRARQVVRMAAAVLVGGLSELLVEWLAGRIDVSRDQLVEDATELLLAVADGAASRVS